MLGGVPSPPLPFLDEVSSPFPLLKAMRWERKLLLGRFSPLLLLPWLHTGRARCLVRMSPYTPGTIRMHALLCGGSPPSSISWLRAVRSCGLVGVSPSHPWPHTGNARCCVGSPPPPLVAARIKRTMPFRGS